MTGVRAGSVRRIPTDGGGQVPDAVIVRRGIYRRVAVAGTVAGGAGDILTAMERMLTCSRRNGMTASACRRRCRIWRRRDNSQ